MPRVRLYAYLCSPRLTQVDLALAGCVAFIGALIRLYQLQLIPAFTDEIHEIEFAFQIAQGGYWPIVSYDTYNGPGFHYLLALGIWMGGGAGWPRLLPFILGVLTVCLTYFLGRSLTALHRPDDPALQRLAGLLAAALMTVSFTSVIVNSRLAWSNSSSPFWTTLFLLALSEAVRFDQPRRLVLVAVLGGLAQQTHPSIIVIILGAGLWAALMRPRWLLSRWTGLSILVLVVCVSNLLLFTLTSGGANIAQASTRYYAWTGGTNLPDYLSNVRGFLVTGYEVIGSTFRSALAPHVRDTVLFSPPLLLYGLLTLLALAYTVRRAGLPVACWLVALILIPYFNRRYNAYIEGRYLAPLLPATFGVIGTLLATWLASAWRHPSLRFDQPAPTLGLVANQGRFDSWSGAQVRRLLSGLVAGACLGVLLIYPLVRLNDHYEFQSAQGRTNARIWQVIHALQEPAAKGELILIDRGLKNVHISSGMNIYRVLEVLLDLDRIPNDKQRVEKLADAPVGAYMVLTDERRAILAHKLKLEPVDVGAPIAHINTSGFWVYRVTATDD